MTTPIIFMETYIIKSVKKYPLAYFWNCAGCGKRFFLKLRKGKRPKLPSLYFKKLLPSYPDKKKQSPTIVNCTKPKRLYTITTVL